jgi:hypothetical protein
MATQAKTDTVSVEQDGTVRDPRDVLEETRPIPYTLDEVLAVFRVDELVDEPRQHESWLDEAARDSLRGSSLA